MARSVRVVALSLILCSSSFALEAQSSLTNEPPTLSPARYITMPRLEGGTGGKSARSVASDGEFTYAIWTANKCAFISVFDREGALLLEKRIGESGAFPYPPALIHDGSQLVVAWSTLDSILVSPLTPQLDLVRPSGFVVASGPGLVDLAHSRDAYLITWLGGGYSPQTSAVLLDSAFLRVRSGVIAKDTTLPSVATDGENFFLVWSDNYPSGGDYGNGVHLLKVTSSSLGGRPVTIVGGAWRSYPAVTWNGSEYLVTWGGFDKTFRGLLLTPEGVAGSPFTIHTVSRGDPAWSAPAWNGNEFLVPFDVYLGGAGVPEAPDASELYYARLAADGTRIGEVTPISTVKLRSGFPSSVWNGESWFVSWSSLDASASWYDYAIRYSLISPTGEIAFADRPVPGAALSRAPNYQFAANLANGSGTTLAVWIEQRKDKGEIANVLGRVGRRGEPLDEEGITLSSIPGGGSTQPRIGCNASRCLAVYTTSGYGIEARWLAPDGALVGEPWMIAVTPRSAIASDGESFAFLSAGTKSSDPHGITIVGLDSSMRRFDLLTLAGGEYGPESQSLASNGEGYVAVTSIFGSSNPRTLIQRVAPNGQVVTRAILYGTRTSVTLSSDGDGYLMVYEMPGFDSRPGDLYGQRLDREGDLVGPPFPVSNAPERKGTPSVTFDGRNYVVAWSALSGSEYYGAVKVGRVTPDGHVLDGLPGGGIVVSEAARSPQLAAGGGGQPVIVYETKFEQPYQHVSRIQYRVLQDAPKRFRGVRRP